MPKCQRYKFHFDHLNAQSETSILIAVVFCDEMKEGGNCILKKIWPFNEQYIHSYIHLYRLLSQWPKFFCYDFTKKKENSKRKAKFESHLFTVLKYGFCKKYIRYKWTSASWTLFSSLFSGLLRTHSKQAKEWGKVFNWQRLIFTKCTSYKIHILTR